MGRTGGVVRGASGGALACALYAALTSAAAARGQEPPAFDGGARAGLAGETEGAPAEHGESCDAGERTTRHPDGTLRAAIDLGQADALDDQALAALLRAEGEGALPLVARLVEGSAAAERALRARVLRVLPAALSEQGELLLVGLAGAGRPRDVRLEALDALAAAADADAVPALLGHLADPDVLVRAAAVLAIEGVVARGAEPVRVAVGRALRDLVADAAATAATATELRRAAGALAVLVAVDGEAALEDLERGLSHPQAAVRAAVLATLASPALLPERSGRVAVREALLRALAAAAPRREGAIDEKRLVLEALAWWGEPASCILPVLEAIEADPACRDPGLESLRRLVGHDAGDVPAWWRLWARGAGAWPGLDVFLATLEAGEPEAVTDALGELAVLPDPRTFEGIERLVRRLAAGDAWSRARGEAQAVAACRALGALRDRRGVPALLVVLEAPGVTDPARTAAHQALIRITGRTGPAHVAFWRDVLPARAPAPLTRADAWRVALLPPPVVPTPPRQIERVGAIGDALAWAAPEKVRAGDLLALWPMAGALLTITGLSMALRRRRDDAPSREVTADATVPARIEDASSAATAALRSLETSMFDLRRGGERRRFTSPPTFGPTGAETSPRVDDDLADEAPDADDGGVVHVVLGTAPRWRTEAPPPSAASPAPAPDEDPAWRESLEGLAELGANVTRAWTRVRGRDGACREELVYDGGAGGRTLDDTLSGLRARRVAEEVEALEIEMAGARLPLYRRPDLAPDAALEPREAEVTCVDDPAWRGLLAALGEMGPSVAAVWARLDDDPSPRTLWSREQPGGLAAATAALGEARGRVRQAGVRLVGSPADLVLFEADAGGDGRAADEGAGELEAGFLGTLEALRAMGGAVRMLAARLSIDAPAAGPRVLYPAPECRELDDALAALESLEPLVLDVRTRLVGADADLVLLDRSVDPASCSAGQTASGGQQGGAQAPVVDAWEELVDAIEELAPRLDHVVVRGTDDEDLVVFPDDDGGVPALLVALRSLQGLVAHVRVRFAGSETELVLLDAPVAARRDASFRELVGGATRPTPRCLAA